MLATGEVVRPASFFNLQCLRILELGAPRPQARHALGVSAFAPLVNGAAQVIKILFF